MKDGIRDKVAIVGVGACQFGENWDKSREDMIVEASYEAYEDAGIEDPQKQIEAVFCGSVYPREGSAEVAEALKIFGKPISMLMDYCQTGTDAFRFGVFAVACGMYDTVLVVGFDKTKDRGVSGPSVNFDRVRGLPATPAGWFSLCAARYFETFGAGREDLAKIAVKNHHNGTLAPKSFLKREITGEDVLNARMISWPFGLYDCAAQTDGAAAVVLTRSDLARSFRDDPIYIKGIGLSVSYGRPHYNPAYRYDGFPATRNAAAQAYEQAGVTPDEIDLAETHDCFTITEILNYEDLGFCARGEGGKAAEEGRFALDGEMPVNPSGGLKSFGHPIGATGVRMLYEPTQHLRGQAGERQVQGAELGLAHNLGGLGGVACVTILGNQR